MRTLSLWVQVLGMGLTPNVSGRRDHRRKPATVPPLDCRSVASGPHPKAQRNDGDGNTSSLRAVDLARLGSLSAARSQLHRTSPRNGAGGRDAALGRIPRSRRGRALRAGLASLLGSCEEDRVALGNLLYFVRLPDTTGTDANVGIDANVVRTPFLAPTGKRPPRLGSGPIRSGHRGREPRRPQ